MQDVFPSSPMAATPKKKAESKYPWETIQPGYSFAVQFNEMKLNNLRSYASRMGKFYNKKFRVLKHENVYEVACLKAQAIEKEKQDEKDKTD